FTLGELKPEDALDELSALNLLVTPAVFEKTKRLLVTDTVEKLRIVQGILAAFQPNAMDNGTVIKSFRLEHVEAEDVLVVARPHLGLATGEMIGIDVSISADVLGENIFVTGVEDKVDLIEGLVKAIDQPEQERNSDGGPPELMSYSIPGGNVDIVYDVLQTILAGEDVRLSIDEDSQSIVVLATPDVQSNVAATVEQLQAAEAEFEVIELRYADPFFVISLIDQMLDLEEGKDDEVAPPKIDADPNKRRLFVRGKRSQIDQVKAIVDGLDNRSLADDSPQIRLLPIRGQQAKQVLGTATKFWQNSNPVIYYAQPENLPQDSTEKVLQPTFDSDPSGHEARYSNSEVTLTATMAGARRGEQALWLSGNASSDEAMIRCQMTPRGLLIHSTDTEALDRFEDHLRTVAGPLDSIPAPPTIYYLKYTRAEDAIRMLAELIDGGAIANEITSESLVNGVVSSSSGRFLGSILMSRDGTITLSAGTLTVVADPRLNRLISQGSAADLEAIEGYLSIIDKDTSLTSIETYGMSRLIELENSRASEVAEAIRQAFSTRLASGGANAASQAGGQNKDRPEGKDSRDRDDDSKSDKADVKARPKTTAKDLEPKMTIAVHEQSNSLIVTAPEALFLEVQRLAESIDARAEEVVQIVVPSNGVLLNSMLQQVLLGEAPSPRQRSAPSRQSSSRSR
ncbi:MAG: secretin N-terminal domain-containing protein, partial [Planctomycetota bacterium]